MEATIRKTAIALVVGVALICTLAPISKAHATENEIGGWSETSGYFAEDSGANENTGIVLAKKKSTVKHTGKCEKKNIKGTDNKRAHGWTTWVGVKHYTVARIEHNFPYSGVIKTSGRIWGKNGTEAISPWNPFKPNDDWGIAKTYYGRK